jgi:hypothetical protein
MAMAGAVCFVSGAWLDCAECVLMQRQLSPGPDDRGIACSPSVIWRFISAYFPAAGACTGSCYRRAPAEADLGRLEAWQGSCLVLHDSLKRRPPCLGVWALMPGPRALAVERGPGRPGRRGGGLHAGPTSPPPMSRRYSATPQGSETTWPRRNRCSSRRETSYGRAR